MAEIRLGASPWEKVSGDVRTKVLGPVVVNATAVVGTEILRALDGAVLFDGTAGVVPVSGAGTRAMWSPAKAAWRSGLVDGTQWDNANVGDKSWAHGENVQALAAGSYAIGKDTLAERLFGWAQANGLFVIAGDRQTTQFEISRETTDSTQLELTKDGAAPVSTTLPTTNRIRLEDDRHYMIFILLTAMGDRTQFGSDATAMIVIGAHKIGGVITVTLNTTPVSANNNYSLSTGSSGDYITVSAAGSGASEEVRHHAHVIMVETHIPAGA